MPASLIPRHGLSERGQDPFRRVLGLGRLELLDDKGVEHPDVLFVQHEDVGALPRRRYWFFRSELS